ncbi:MAG: selenium cofactor biosynthesis protein YqeC [Anaerocolumna sp.]
MKLYQALGLHQDRRLMVSFVGGGGKTSTLLKLAYELAEEGFKVLITTTTAMYNLEEEIHPLITVLGDHVNTEGKLKGITKERANKIHMEGQYDFILVEADGSKGRPIKAPAQHEPVIPKATQIVVGVIGMDAIGQKISSDYVHRPEILAELTQNFISDDIKQKTNIEQEAIIEQETIVRLVSEPMGLFKDCPTSAKRVLLLNKVIDESLKDFALMIGEEVLRRCMEIDRVLIGAVLEEDPVKVQLCKEPIV